MTKDDIKSIIANKPEFKDKIFARGFVFSNYEINDNEYPFYGLWNNEIIGKYRLLVAPKQNYYICGSDVIFILVGHAYDPFNMISDENELLEELSEKYGKRDFWRFFNGLTGVFTLIIVDGSDLKLIGDASGMQTAFYTVNNHNVFISTHTNLIGDLLDLKWDSYVKELSNYKFFKLLGNSLPGDLTQFDNVKRLIPNHYVLFKNGEIIVKRFYYPKKLQISKKEIVDRVAKIMHNNMELIANKWNHPAISLTGGCDSKTTLACTAGLYDKFSYFSYISNDSEKVDAEAAQKICKALKIKHSTYIISNNDHDYDNIKDIATILFWNSGGIIKTNSNDVRKRAFFADTGDFDVEVKSWASEIGRSYYSKRFNGYINFGVKPTPRKCTTMYKFFLHNRRLVYKTDLVFKEYLRKYFRMTKIDTVEWQDQFFWEFRVPSWNGLVITGEHRYSFDITIPYNNRCILELLLSASINERINDNIYSDIRQKMNPTIDATGIAITNVKHTKNREKAEKIYYLLNSKLLF